METQNNNWYTPAQIAEISAKAKTAVDIKDRKNKFKTYKSCFIGREFCKWLIVNGVSHVFIRSWPKWEC